ncbi:MAG: hypothetical protein U0841_13835 [Chloroflexia bacterium]
MLDKDAKLVELLSNEIVLRSTTAIRVPSAGTYTFNVQSSGRGTTTRSSPAQPNSGRTSHRRRSSRGDSTDHSILYRQFRFAARNLSHDGKRNFIVKLLNTQGQLVDLSANEIGAFNGSVGIRIPANGVYIFVIEADGAVNRRDAIGEMIKGWPAVSRHLPARATTRAPAEITPR